MQSEIAGVRSSESSSYDDYVRAEWARFTADPARNRVACEVASSTEVSRALDIGCGAGQELRPFVARSSFGVGVDVSPEAGRAGRELFGAEQPGSRIAFARARAEQLPFDAGSFDVVICRLALPYTDNRQALREMARVLRPGGALLLKFHHARYYSDQLRDAIALRRFKPLVHACRVLLAGGLYQLTGHQPRGPLIGRETFQTVWMLKRELRRYGLEVQRVLEDSVPAAPSLLIRRRSDGPCRTPAPLERSAPHREFIRTNAWRAGR